MPRAVGHVRSGRPFAFALRFALASALSSGSGLRLRARPLAAGPPPRGRPVFLNNYLLTYSQNNRTYHP